MIYKTLVVFVLLLSLVACGRWRHQCVKPTSYNLGEEKITVVGSEMVSIGCLAAQKVRRSIIKPDNHFEPFIEKELLYSGRVGDILHITYREYSNPITTKGLNSYARQAFFQQVQYDLKTSDTIVFQDWVLQVLDANNQQIRFKVIKEPLRSLKSLYFYPPAK